MHCGVRFPKCPKWFNQRLIFLDVHDGCIKSTDLRGNVQTEIDLPYQPGAFEILPTGDILVGDAWSRKLYRMENHCQQEIADLSSVARTCLADSIVATDGQIYIGDVGYDFLDPLVDPVPSGSIMHIGAQGQVTPVATNLFFPNGMVITADKNTLIVAETLGHRLTAFDIAEDGSLGEGRLWAHLPDDIRPDGICLDCDGAIWVATTTPRAFRILEGGQIVDEVIAQQEVFSVTLGGLQGKQLFLCTSASSDPVITRRTPCASIEIAPVKIAGVSTLPESTKHAEPDRPVIRPAAKGYPRQKTKEENRR